MIKHERTTCGIVNCRDSSKFKVCSPLKRCRILTNLNLAIGN